MLTVRPPGSRPIERNRLASLLVACGVFLGAAGCSGSYTPAPAYPPGAQDNTPSQEGMDETVASPMTLEPGDVISIRTVSAATETIEGLVVDESGRVHLPLAGDVLVGSLELRAAETRIEEALRQFDRFVRVSIAVTSPAGHRITVMGSVAHPGSLPIPPGARIADAIALAGGLVQHVSDAGDVEQIADPDNAAIVRDGRALPISLTLALRGEPRHNVRVRPGDQIYVPARAPGRVTVFGEVGTPHEIPFRRGLRLTQALALAGGETIRADDEDIRIMRGTSARPQVYGASLDNIIDGETHDPVLVPGDIVYVERSAWADLGEFFSRIGLIASAALSVGIAALIINSSR